MYQKLSEVNDIGLVKYLKLELTVYTVCGKK